MTEWTTVKEPNIVNESPRAILMDFSPVSIDPKIIWVPRSVYRLTRDGKHQIKTWFVRKECLEQFI